MKREIKFRGKDSITQEWLFGNLIQRIGYHPGIMFQYNDNGKVRYCEHDIIPSTVGQFTGLHDSKGKEIYEGDIVDFGLPAVVKYHPFLCSFILDCEDKEPHYNDSYSELGKMKKLSKKFVVIGNIHDNPSLLEGGAE